MITRFMAMRPAHGHPREEREQGRAGDDQEPEEVLPETEVPSLDGDELLEDAAQVGRCDVAQAPVEREVEELVEDESPREARAGALQVRCGYHATPSVVAPWGR
jgi:hypothetical protein